ncbi:preprotein translocase subunit SecB [Methylomagnum ishizawai]|uniref:Protein-export protein SecB n=1 Tax=Methylomagnum ishizawai TaxID=1760988 RepID=A0A1Y6D8D8_9GAMM|nr:protein-export chaperone SecB [Methylomagnum ishizawai]SMF96692.1 preprotein translocase subunit SecB [Methylomagnum ishizawai]
MAEANAQQPERQFALQKIYIKDVSFETPHSPEVFTLNWEPKVEFNLASNAQQLQEGLFEVGLTVTLTVKVVDKTAYLIEICQAGIFSILGFQEQEYGHLLGSYCPTVLFPYAREAVSDLVIKGGFPPMLLAPVNFDALYMQHLQQLQQQAEAPTNH